MHGFWLLVHVLGFTLWLGGGIATMVCGVVAKSFKPAERLSAYKVTGAVQRLLVGPGAGAVVLSGVVLVLNGPFMQSGEMPAWLNAMMGCGIVGAIIAVAVSVPTASRLSHLEVTAKGELPDNFARLRKRQVLAATFAGSLGLIALFAATLAR